jgi:hypothetical protein
MVSVTPGYFFQPGKNSLSLKQLAGLPKTPWRDLLATRVGRIDDQGRFDNALRHGNMDQPSG